MSGRLFVQALLRETGRILSADDIAQLQQADASSTASRWGRSPRCRARASC